MIEAAASMPRRRGAVRRFAGRLGSREAAVGLSILALLALVAILAPLLAPHSPESIDANRVLAGPSLSHPFGSDALGRDVLSRVLFAFRCFSAAEGCAHAGQPTLEATWFAGRAWIYAFCGGCGGHLGWKWESAPPFWGRLSSR